MLRRTKKMRTKNILIFLVLITITSFLFFILGPATEQNDSLKNIMSQTHQQIQVFKDNLSKKNDKSLEIDEKYLEMLGFKPTTAAINTPNGRLDFCIVTYVRAGQLDTAVLFVQSVQMRLPNVTMLIYDLGLSEDDQRTLTTSPLCNNSKCTVIPFDLSAFPDFVADERMHAFRPLIIKNALSHAKLILFTENENRVRSNVTTRDLTLLTRKTENSTLGVLGWTTNKQAVSSRTHQKMFEYFDMNPESFYFIPMVSMSAVFFVRTPFVIQRIMLPWIKCVLTQECVCPIGAQSGGCKYNKKPLYRYMGCHSYDESAFNIVLGKTSKLDETKYSETGETPLFYTETLEQATKILENRRKNASDASERPFTEI
ncbi:uncharacterized protein LOC134836838 [Culicoides brevitarsis]|uniref:uncharacterized protein LOC134836838 n=1 Tax=Culicoides brevitarsis TaxID=469753 RepID=UPI00307B7B0A